MTRAEHLAKAQRILASLKKLAPDADAMCIVDGAVIAGYHLGNALLHAADICGNDVHFNTPSKLDRSVAELPSHIRPAFEAFTELERLRTRYVRSPSPCDAAAVMAVWEQLSIMLRVTL